MVEQGYIGSIRANWGHSVYLGQNGTNRDKPGQMGTNRDAWGQTGTNGENWGTNGDNWGKTGTIFDTRKNERARAFQLFSH